MQTILGAGGVIGREISRQLSRCTDHIRQVSRSPAKVTGSDELFFADLLDVGRTAGALEEGQVAYLTAGLPCETEVWERGCPRIMDNLLEGWVYLVFFGNVCAYGRVEWPMDSSRSASGAR